ncbi:hypothetical protein GN956_G5208 [Arapaima gigas]
MAVRKLPPGSLPDSLFKTGTGGHELELCHGSPVLLHSTSARSSSKLGLERPIPGSEIQTSRWGETCVEESGGVWGRLSGDSSMWSSSHVAEMQLSQRGGFRQRSAGGTKPIVWTEMKAEGKENPNVTKPHDITAKE